MSDIEVRIAAPDEVIDLRHAVLRPGFPREASLYDIDTLPTTCHFIASTGGRVVGCVTIFPERWEGRDDAWRLRGMAVADDVRQGGVGRRLLEAVDQSLRGLTPLPLIWCQARVTAIRFYERCGWTVASEVFELPPIGPHVKMTRQV